jgi:hypothetical protein
LISGAAGGSPRDVVDLPEVVLDEVRVVARRRGHHEELPAARVERDDGPHFAPSASSATCWASEVERRDDRVADDRLARELVELLVDEVARSRVGAGQDRR